MCLLQCCEGFKLFQELFIFRKFSGSDNKRYAIYSLAFSFNCWIVSLGFIVICKQCGNKGHISLPIFKAELWQNINFPLFCTHFFTCHHTISQTTMYSPKQSLLYSSSSASSFRARFVLPSPFSSPFPAAALLSRRSLFNPFILFKAIDSTSCLGI